MTDLDHLSQCLPSCEGWPCRCRCHLDEPGPWDDTDDGEDCD